MMGQAARMAADGVGVASAAGAVDVADRRKTSNDLKVTMEYM